MHFHPHLRDLVLPMEVSDNERSCRTKCLCKGHTSVFGFPSNLEAHASAPQTDSRAFTRSTRPHTELSTIARAVHELRDQGELYTHGVSNSIFRTKMGVMCPIQRACIQWNKAYTYKRHWIQRFGYSVWYYIFTVENARSYCENNDRVIGTPLEKRNLSC